MDPGIYIIEIIIIFLKKILDNEIDFSLPINSREGAYSFSSAENNALISE